MTKPKLAVEQPDGSRRYIHPISGEIVPSVTTVIDMMPKPWMGPYAAKQAALHAIEHWNRLSQAPQYQIISELKEAHIEYAEDKADIGDIVHELVDCWATGKPYPDPPKQVAGYINQFIRFLTEKRPIFIENEVTLFSRQWDYAGTADFIIEVDGIRYLADLKTGKSLHEELGLQLSALGHCDFILRADGTEDPFPRVDRYAGLHLRPRSWKFVIVNEIEPCFQAFLAAKDILFWMNNIKPKVLP